MARVSAGELKDHVRHDERLYLCAYVPTVKLLCALKEAKKLTPKRMHNRFRALAFLAARDLGKPYGRTDDALILEEAARLLTLDFEAQYRATGYKALRGR